MTREEAVKIFNETTNIHDQSATGRWIDKFVALGMLKLDEPKSAIGKAEDALFGFAGTGTLTPRQALDVLYAVGLKIVEK